jgi:hypothetical protein
MHFPYTDTVIFLGEVEKVSIITDPFTVILRHWEELTVEY